ncbi:MAG TPA: ABC transporter permease [Bacteroidales bacterium]|nr:ABC transporter permease [Bacteroidales bacterium]
MIKNYIKITFRRFLRNRVTSVIKLLSLVIGMVCFILISLYAYYEFSFDRFNTNSDEIVRITADMTVNGNQEQWALTGTKTGPEFKRNYSLVKAYTRIYKVPGVVKSDEAVYNEKRFLYVDSDFLKIFSFPLLEGNRSTALDAPSKIVLTKSMAEKYFGTEDPLGKTILVNGEKSYEVSGVAADVPENSQVVFDFLASFSNLGISKNESWFPANFLTYLLLDKGTDISLLESKFNDYVHSLKDDELENSGLDNFRFNLEPLTEVHLHSKTDGLTPNMPLIYIRILILVAILILSIGYINYTNLTIAQASKHEKEIIIRRVLGSGKKQLFTHFFSESVIYSLIAIILSLYFVTLILPSFNNLTGRMLPASLLLNPVITGIILSSCLLVSFVAGLYPTLIISKHAGDGRLKPGTTGSVSGGSFRKTLIIFQFVVSITLIIITLIIRQQRTYIQNKNIGYNRENVISVQLGKQVWPKYYNLKEALKSDPYVENVSAGNVSPTEVRWTNFMSVPTETGEKKFITRALPVDLGYLKTLGISIIAGSDFTESDFKRLKASEINESFSFDLIINETAAKKIGWTPEEAIGRKINTGFNGTVKAVVKDFNIASMHEAIMPLVIFLYDNYINTMVIRLQGNDTPAALASVKKTWNEYIPDKPFEYRFLNEEYDALYRKEQKSMQIFSSFAMISIFLACLGLFGIVAVIIVQRTKEIAVRKVMGASVQTVVLRLISDYVRPVLTAILIAFPIAYFSSYAWLKGFAYRIPIQWWVFIVSGLLIMVIAFLTICTQAVKAALSNPASSIRHE